VSQPKQSKRRGSVRILWLLKLCVTFVITFASCELIAWFWFHYNLPVDLRESALFSVYGKIPNSSQMRIPMIQPYIWANYRPNPRSPEANEYGWRYGGGPKDLNVFRILCLGGSTTWSQKVSRPEHSYPARLEQYLRKKGYYVDVVNGGAPYFTSAELVGTLAFRGIYTSPNLVIIHTGGNDTAPLRSPRDYRADYTHWRTVDPASAELSNTERFRVLWEVPSWTIRLFLTYRLRPNALYRQMVGKQLTGPAGCLLADNNISHRDPVGLKNNLRTLIAISRAHGAKVVGITFNMRYENLTHIVPQLAADSQLSARVVRRLRQSMDKSNDALRKVCASLSVPVIPFDEFETTRPDYWVDQCHLSDEGAYEKAVFIGNNLLKYDVIPRRFRRNPKLR